MKVETPFKRVDGKTLSVYVHDAVASRFTAACADAVTSSTWRPQRIDSYANRPIRGSLTTSQHAYGLAFDFFDLPWPKRVDVWGAANAPDEAFRQAFERHGFRCGARWRVRKDYPHIEWAGPLPV